LPHPNARLRSTIIPAVSENANNIPDDPQGMSNRPSLARISWARLLKRVFDIDIEHCSNCGGTLKIIAAIEDPAVIAKILTHLGLPARAPPQVSSQSFDLFDTA